MGVGQLLKIGNISYLFSVLKDADKNNIAKYYSDKYNEQYHHNENKLRLSSEDFEAGLKVVNLTRNICAHDERLYNVKFSNTRLATIANFVSIDDYNNRSLISVVLFLHVVLDKKDFKNYIHELLNIFEEFEQDFTSIRIEKILDEMGVNYKKLYHLASRG